MPAVTVVLRWPDSGDESAEAERRGMLTEGIADLADGFDGLTYEIHPEDLTGGAS